MTQDEWNDGETTPTAHGWYVFQLCWDVEEGIFIDAVQIPQDWEPTKEKRRGWGEWNGPHATKEEALKWGDQHHPERPEDWPADYMGSK